MDCRTREQAKSVWHTLANQTCNRRKSLGADSLKLCLGEYAGDGSLLGDGMLRRVKRKSLAESDVVEWSFSLSSGLCRRYDERVRRRVDVAVHGVEKVAIAIVFGVRNVAIASAIAIALANRPEYALFATVYFLT